MLENKVMVRRTKLRFEELSFGWRSGTTVRRMELSLEK